MADLVLSQLTEVTTPTETALLYVLNDPGVTPADRKITIANLRTAILNLAGLVNATPGNAGNVATSNGTAWISKAIVPRFASVASAAAPAINTNLVDCFSVTALATTITSFTTNLTGSPVDFQSLIIRIRDNGSARAITWGSSFAAMGTSLPTTTFAGKTMNVALRYDAILSVWGCLAVSQQA